MDLTTKILDLSACYRRISAVFPYFPRLDFDFEGWYEECVRRAVTAEDEKTYHLTLMAFLNRLGDGHTDYTPPRAWLNRIGYLPFRLEAFPEGYYRQGRRVLALDGVSMEEWADRMEKILPGRENFLYPGPFQAYLPLFLTGGNPCVDHGNRGRILCAGPGASEARPVLPGGGVVLQNLERNAPDAPL